MNKTLFIANCLYAITTIAMEKEIPHSEITHRIIKVYIKPCQAEKPTSKIKLSSSPEQSYSIHEVQPTSFNINNITIHPGEEAYVPLFNNELYVSPKKMHNGNLLHNYSLASLIHTLPHTAHSIELDPKAYFTEDYISLKQRSDIETPIIKNSVPLRKDWLLLNKITYATNEYIFINDIFINNQCSPISVFSLDNQFFLEQIIITTKTDQDTNQSDSEYSKFENQENMYYKQLFKKNGIPVTNNAKFGIKTTILSLDASICRKTPVDHVIPFAPSKQSMLEKYKKTYLYSLIPELQQIIFGYMVLKVSLIHNEEGFKLIADFDSFDALPDK